MPEQRCAEVAIHLGMTNGELVTRLAAYPREAIVSPHLLIHADREGPTRHEWSIQFLVAPASEAGSA